MVYIGKTHGDIKSLAGRISAHAREEIFKEYRTGYVIDFVECASPADADALETALIARDVKNPKFNKGKTNWGVCTIIDFSRLVWKPWPPETENVDSHRRVATKLCMDSYKYRCDICGALVETKNAKPDFMYIEECNCKFTGCRTLFLCNNCCAITSAAVHSAIDRLK